jgi:hypothetical protein
LPLPSSTSGFAFERIGTGRSGNGQRKKLYIRRLRPIVSPLCVFRSPAASGPTPWMPTFSRAPLC